MTFEHVATLAMYICHSLVRSNQKYNKNRVFFTQIKMQYVKIRCENVV